jgi:hypothetical protein
VLLRAMLYLEGTIFSGQHATGQGAALCIRWPWVPMGPVPEQVVKPVHLPQCRQVAASPAGGRISSLSVSG